MASVQPIKSKKDGKTIVSYKFKVLLGTNGAGKPQFATKTVKPIENMTPKKMLAELQRQADTWEKEIKAGIAPIKKTTFKDIAEEWFSIRIANGGKSANTARFYKEMLPKIIDKLGKFDVERIKQKDIEKFLNDLANETKENGEKRYSPRTVHHYYAAINAIFNFAEVNDYVIKNVMRKVTPPQKPKRALKENEDFLSEDEARRFLDALKDESIMWRCMMTMLILTGIRRGEACGLQWSDIDFENFTISISKNVTYTSATGVQVGKTKTETSVRVLPVPPQIIFLLKALKADSENGMKLLPSAFVFHSDTDPYKPMFPTSPTTWLARFCKAHELPTVSPHDLRHTCGTLMLANGATVKEVQNTLGHSNASVTLNFYVGTDAKALREASRKLSNALGF